MRHRGGDARTGRLSQAGGASETVSERERNFRQEVAPFWGTVQTRAYQDAYERWAKFDEAIEEMEKWGRKPYTVDMAEIEQRVITQLTKEDK